MTRSSARYAPPVPPKAPKPIGTPLHVLIGELLRMRMAGEFQTPEWMGIWNQVIEIAPRGVQYGDPLRWLDMMDIFTHLKDPEWQPGTYEKACVRLAFEEAGTPPTKLLGQVLAAEDDDDLGDLV